MQGALGFKRYLAESRANHAQKISAGAPNLVSPRPHVIDQPPIESPEAPAEAEETVQQGEKKRGETKQARVQITHIEDNHNTRIVRLNVSVTDASSSVTFNQDCKALGRTRAGNLVLYYMDESGELRVLAADKTLISSSISSLIKATAVKPLKQTQVPRIQFEDADFLGCSVLRTPRGASESGYFLITKQGPLFGKVCDEDMKCSIINSMSYFFQECNKSFKIYWISENLIPKSSSNFALSQLSVLSAARGIVRARNLDVLRQLNLPGAVLSIGNRPVYFASEKKLDGRLLEPDDSVEEPLAVLRYLLGCGIESKLGEFICCSNQVLLHDPNLL